MTSIDRICYCSILIAFIAALYNLSPGNAFIKISLNLFQSYC